MKSDKNLFSEWTTARDILTEYDGMLHDLRKYGFSFLTALLAAESVLVPTIVSKSGVEGGTVLPNSVKVAVLVVNFLLIILLRLLDRNYEVFQDAAATRALVLEKKLNLELTEIISVRYNGSHVRSYITGLYAAFVLGVYGIGWVVLSPDWLSIEILTAFFVVSIFFVAFVFGQQVRVLYPCGRIDWSISRLDCRVGDEIEITLTNLFERPISFQPGCVMWDLRKQNSTKSEHTEQIPVSGELTIRAGDSYTWIWKAEQIGDIGIHQIHRCVLHLTEKWPSTFQSEASLYNLQEIKVDNEDAYGVEPTALHLNPLSRKLSVKAPKSQSAQPKRKANPADKK